MIFPIGHDEGTVRRWPLVTIAIVVLCFLVHLAIVGDPSTFDEKAADAGVEAVHYWAERPWLDLDPQLAGRFSEYLDGLRDEASSRLADAPGRALVRRQQEELDRCTDQWKTAWESSPYVRFGLIPSSFEAPDLLGSMFLHASWSHLLFNMFFLWMVGPPLEDIWGRWAYAAFYLAVGLLSGAGWVLLYPTSGVPLVGASGAVAGLMGAFAVRYRFSKIRFAYAFFIFPLGFKTGTFSAQAWIMLGLWALREVVFGAALGSGSSVAHWVHVAGFGAGFVGAIVLAHLRMEDRFERAVDRSSSLLRNDVLDEAHAARARGDLEKAWSLLLTDLRARPAQPDVTVALWDVSLDLQRARDAAPWMLRTIQNELREGERDLAIQHWEELVDHAPETPVALPLRVAIAEALVEAQMDPQAVRVLHGIEAGLSPAVPLGLLVKAARIARKAGSPAALPLIERALENPALPVPTREELQGLRATAWPPDPSVLPRAVQSGVAHRR